ncbi:MAG: hypothetical protein ACK4KT_07080 [Thermaurantimonas sp.]
MKAKINEIISLYHEMELAPTPSDIFRLFGTHSDFVGFNALLAQMAEHGELVYENNKYALPDFKALIEATWNRELEAQYFINQFRVIRQILKFFPFIKSVGVCKNSFYNDSNEVFLNFIVERGTVFTSYRLMSTLLKWFDKHSIFDTKIQFIIENGADLSADEYTVFFVSEVYPIFGNYFLKNLGSHFILTADTSQRRRSNIGTLLANTVEPILSRTHDKHLTAKKKVYSFCNIQKFVDKIVAFKKVSRLLHSL